MCYGNNCPMEGKGGECILEDSRKDCLVKIFEDPNEEELTKIKRRKRNEKNS